MRLTSGQADHSMSKKIVKNLLIICLSSVCIAWGDDPCKKAYDRLTFQPRMSLVEALRDVTSIRHNVRSYGAVGDGHHDDTQSIRNTVASAKAGDAVFFPPGKYLVTAPIMIDKSRITIKGEHAEILFRPVKTRGVSFRSLTNGKSYGKRFSSSVFLIQGNLELSGYKVSGNYTESATRLECPASSEKFAKGDLVVVISSDHGTQVRLPKKKLHMNREQNFISRIESVEESAIVIADPLPFPLEAENNPLVFRINAVVNVNISDLKIAIDPAKQGVENISGITLIFAAGTVMHNISVRHASKESVNIQHGYQCKISECNLTDMVRFTSENGLGVNLDRSHFCVIQNNYIANCRHGVLLNHGNSNCVVEQNKIEGAKSIAAIDLHGEFNSYNVIRENTIFRCKAGIAVGGGGDQHYNDGPFNVLTGNQVTDCEIGIQIKNKTPSTIIGDNKIHNIKFKHKELMIMDTSPDDIIRIKKDKAHPSHLRIIKK